MTWFFFSTPDSAIPSGYFKRFPVMLRYLSRRGIFRFRLWQGTVDAPVPVGICHESEVDELSQESPQPWCPTGGMSLISNKILFPEAP
jgi:hypothetical protein